LEENGTFEFLKENKNFREISNIDKNSKKYPLCIFFKKFSFFSEKVQNKRKNDKK